MMYPSRRFKSWYLTLAISLIGKVKLASFDRFYSVVARQFGINSCPAVVIKTKLQSKFQTVLSYEGFLEAQHIVGLVQSVLLAAEAEYAQAEELNSIRSLQQEQDEAYRRSVEADLAKRRSRTVSREASEEAATVSSTVTSDPVKCVVVGSF